MLFQPWICAAGSLAKNRFGELTASNTVVNSGTSCRSVCIRRQRIEGSQEKRLASQPEQRSS